MSVPFLGPAPGVIISMDESVVLADRYELHDVVGRGGMADVYRATDRVLGRQVAVKMLRESADDEIARLRFTAEARTLARLNHEALVTVLDAGVSADMPFLVMEFVEGSTLSQLCSTGAVDLARVGRIGAAVADAVAYAHGQGVIHRDVKPGNVLVGTDDRVKLADFGIARLIGDTVRHTQTGHGIGTAAYLAPEQVQGEELTPAADVYSLGLVLLEALTGVRAYRGTPTEAALARLSRAPHVPEDLPGSWRDLLCEMTAREPLDRPGADVVAGRLRGHSTPDVAGTTLLLPHTSPPAATAGVALAAAPTSWIDRAGDAMARQPKALWTRVRAMDPDRRGVSAALAALVLFLVLVAVVAGGTSGTTSDELPQQTPPELQEPLQDLHDAVNGD